jgi:hypothetical protein
MCAGSTNTWSVRATGLGVATQIGLAVEPAKGSDQPTTAPIFTASSRDAPTPDRAVKIFYRTA